MKERVTGIGGVFFTSKNPRELCEWYQKHLGIDVQAWGGSTFHWHSEEEPEPNGSTTWSIHEKGSEMFRENESGFMINYRVKDLKGLLEVLREEGCQVEDAIEEGEYGIFGWVRDPDGNRVELWQPPEGDLPA